MENGIMEIAEAAGRSPEKSGIPWQVWLSTAALGLTSLVTQIIVLRELLSVFYGNELVIGVLFANWMLLTGLGSYLGRFKKETPARNKFLTPLLILLAVLPYVTVVFLRLLRNVVFPIGTMVGIGPIIVSSIVLLAPYCITAGAAFTLLADRASGADRNAISSVYAIEAFGSVLGGAVFSLILVFVLSTFQILTIVAAIDLTALLAITADKPGLRFGIWILSVILLAPSIMISVDGLTKRFLFPDQEVLYFKDSPYGSLTVTRQAEQLSFFENGSLLASTSDIAEREESVHYAMAQRPGAKLVLLISGAINGAPQEVLKYPVHRLDVVEVNPDIVAVTRRFTHALDDSRVSAINRDPSLFVRTSTESYDVVLLNCPSPSTLQTNRYYTLEFLQALKERMAAGGVLSLALLASTDYESQMARQINSTMASTLKRVFRNVTIIPGFRTYFLASDDTLDTDIGAMVERIGVSNTYVNKFYVDDTLLAQRSRLIRSTFLPGVPVNRDGAPVSYFRSILYWLSYFETNFWIIALLLLALLVFLATQLNVVSIGMFTGGFAASSSEVLLLIAFQILYGYVYQALGLIITIFMAGLAVGSWYRERFARPANVRSFIWIQLAVAGYSFLLPPALLSLRGVGHIPVIVHAAIFLLTFALSVLIGVEFSLASALRQNLPRVTASELYAVDLIGSALGALLMSVLLLPNLGFFGAGVIVGSLSLFSALLAVGKRRAFPVSLA